MREARARAGPNTCLWGHGRVRGSSLATSAPVTRDRPGPWESADGAAPRPARRLALWLACLLPACGCEDAGRPAVPMPPRESPPVAQIAAAGPADIGSGGRWLEALDRASDLTWVGLSHPLDAQRQRAFVQSFDGGRSWTRAGEDVRYRSLWARKQGSALATSGSESGIWMGPETLLPRGTGGVLQTFWRLDSLAGLYLHEIRRRGAVWLARGLRYTSARAWMEYRGTDRMDVGPGLQGELYWSADEGLSWKVLRLFDGVGIDAVELTRADACLCLLADGRLLEVGLPAQRDDFEAGQAPTRTLVEADSETGRALAELGIAEWVHGEGQRLWVSGCYFFSGSRDNPFLLRSLDGGTSWEPIASPGERFEWIDCLPFGQGHCLLCSDQASVYRFEGEDLVGPLASKADGLQRVHADATGTLLGYDKAGVWWQLEPGAGEWRPVFD